jgi:hypothetical protein
MARSLTPAAAVEVLEELGYIGEIGDDREEARQERSLARKYGFSTVNALRNAAWRISDRANPLVCFRARGKRISFWAKSRRKGRVPAHLIPYLFKPRKRKSRGRAKSRR